ncbi:MAG TPA: NAD(P)-dependent oxidoreductase [Pseudolabrys sp.]|nr:NAD(P)-dependent oxidoreductase [Pseudolabrys sp.]
MAAAKKTKGTVGVIGLGIMGGSFAKNLSAAGWRVVGYDPDPARRREAARAGVELANSAADVARKTPVILTSLPKPQALMETARAIATAKLPRKTFVEMSTFMIEDKENAERLLRKAGHGMLDCPVSGTGSQARTGDLVFYASGDSKTIKRLRPMFESFGRHVYDVGAFGNGSRMKYVANLLVAINNVASAEAMVLGMKAGLPPQVIFDLIKSGAGNSRVFELRAPMMVKGNYDDVTMKIDVWDKDMQVIGDYARKIRVPTPMFDASKPIYIKAMKSGRGAQDTAAVCAVLEQMAKFKRKPNKKTR